MSGGGSVDRKKQTEAQRMHKLRFVLRYAYRIPASLLERIDFRAYVDTTLEFDENLKVLIDAYPFLKEYMPKNYQTLSLKYEEQWYEYLYEVFLGAYNQKKEYIELMRDMGFEDVKEFASKLVEEGVLSKEDFEAFFPPEGERKIEKEEVERRLAEQKKLTEFIQSSIEEEKKTMEEPEVRIPDEVRRFCDLLKLEIVGQPSYERLDGFTYDTWIIPVRDEGTGLTVRIIKGHPVTKMNKYKIIRIVNKEHNVVNVLVQRDEALRVEAKIPTTTKVRVVYEQASKLEEEVRKEEKMPSPIAAKVDWSFLRRFVKFVLSSLPQWEHLSEMRRAHGLWTSLKTLTSKCDFALKTLNERYEEGRKRKERGLKVLKDEEIEELWKGFKRMLERAGLNAERFKERFKACIDPSMDFYYNIEAVMKEADEIITEERLKEELYHTQIPAMKFSWKYIRWGLGSIKVKVVALDDAINAKNADATHSLLTDICETASFLVSMLEQLPEIRLLKKVTEKK